MKDLKPNIHTILKDNGSSVESIIKKILPSLDAVRDIKDRDGEVMETVPDWNVRIKGGTLLMTALGYMKVGGDTNVSVINTQLEKEIIEACEANRLRR